VAVAVAEEVVWRVWITYECGHVFKGHLQAVASPEVEPVLRAMHVRGKSQLCYACWCRHPHEHIPRPLMEEVGL